MTQSDKVIRSHGERRGLVGDFYISLACKLLGGGRNGHVNGNGCDIAYYEKGRLIEVKGISRQTLRLPTRQLSKMLDKRDESAFPHIWLAFFTYSRPFNPATKRRKKSQSLYRVSRTRNQLYDFLSRSTKALYVIDLGVVKALTEAQEPTYIIQDNRDVEATRLDAVVLRELTESHWKEKLRQLVVPPSDYRIWKSTVNRTFTGRRMHFTCHVLIRKTPDSFTPAPTFLHKDRKALLKL